jgi:hypothetical protein
MGTIEAIALRGAWTGNRGILHSGKRIVRFHASDLWITCALQFRGRYHPDQWLPHHYTFLYFHDEAVSFAAGHRPCAECRHPAYQSFRTAWAAALDLPAKPAADDVDRVLHWERRLDGGARVTYPAPLSELPDGVFIARDGEPWLVNDGGLRRWTLAGYTDRIDRFDGPAAVLTPRATVAAIRAGYRPLLHSSVSDTSSVGDGWPSARVESD